MDYSRSNLADRLAADYVVGTLRGGARRRFESLLPAHPVLRGAVRSWQVRLMPLTQALPPVRPPERVWTAIDQHLFGAARRGAAPQPSAAAVTRAVQRWWERLGLWQGLSAAASVAAIGLGVALSLPAPIQPPVVVVLSPNQSETRFVASVSADGRSLVLKPIDGVQLTASQAYELWALPPSGAPRSLGLVSARGGTTVQRAQLLKDTAAFAVSIEPPGGSPTGAPTGPVVSVGKIDS
ncbi:anti-sigma factor [Leptothrix discophora]|uniref:Anti-sigma factor n=1 Tax=Leptothrix discophora TaxID=89 RepID=A0ABT9G116_LEPDI|nr:anti-sigma factor [Leptothrix discophora]MDP4300189.1 anti-sigma factor [Leptothrix discophora]